MSQEEVIIDASALVALIKKEEGYQKVLPYVGGLVISAVNLSECFFTLGTVGASGAQMKDLAAIFEQLIHKVEVFDEEQAYLAAELREVTKPYGLSFADRACIALGMHRKLTIITADRVWSKLNLKTKIEIIR